MKKVYPNEFLYGLHVGEHGFIPENILSELQTNCVDRGMNFVTIRPTMFSDIDPQYYLDWARFCAAHHIYFVFLYTLQKAPKGKVSMLTPELVAEMRQIAGPYFLGDMLGENGSVWIGKEKGYYVPTHEAQLDQNAKDMETAHDNYIRAMKKHLENERWLGLDRVGVATVDATIANTYNIEAGVDTPFTELFCCDPQTAIAALRGATRAAGIDFWGTYVAHEWYAGMHSDDMLKRKRMGIGYKYAYMQGSRALCHESGDDGLTAYGRLYPADHEICTDCRKFINEFGAYVKADDRPAGDPIVRIALMQGNHDSWLGGWGASSVWGQLSRPEWGFAEPEWSWRILEEFYTPYKWHVPESYACRGVDLSGVPPYGTFDIIPATAGAEAMSHYRVLIYTGWNTMTEEQLQNLERFVEGGGILLMTAAHLNTNSARGGEYRPVRGGDLSRLFGCRLKDEYFTSNLGLKFNGPPAMDGLILPYSETRVCDPILSNGYSDYVRVELCGGEEMAYLEDSFQATHFPGDVAMVSHKLGKGYAMLMTTRNYPGRNSVYPAYRFLVRELVRRENAGASVRVKGPDTLRYTVYERGDLYLLNTDCDMPILVRVFADGKDSFDVTLAPMELKHLSL